jgi:GAF domain-containing protein
MPSQKTLDDLTQRAVETIKAPVACLSLVSGDERLILSSAGLSAPLAMLVTWPLCRRVIATRLPLVVSDVRHHSLMASQPAVQDGMVMSFAGTPLMSQGGHAIGAMFVMDSQPRHWKSSQLDILRLLGALAMRELDEVQVEPTRCEKAAIWSRVWSASFSMTLRT